MASASTSIRRATHLDATAIHDVLEAAFGPLRNQYTPEAYDATVASPDEVKVRLAEGPIWIAKVDGSPAGTASIVLRLDHEACYIRGMAVRPEARGRQLGRQMLETIEKHARARHVGRLTLSSTPFLDRALALYRASGFVDDPSGPTDLLGTPLLSMYKSLIYG